MSTLNNLLGMIAEEPHKAALSALHGHELEVWLKLQETAVTLGNHSWKAEERYGDLAKRCSPDAARPLSTKTIQRAIQGLRRKGWLTQPPPASRHTPTIFILTVPEEHYALSGPDRPPAIESLSAENRELFLMMKKGISAADLAEIEEEARAWLVQRGKYNAANHRDKIDQLIVQKTFGLHRAEECAPAFASLYE